jgi:hypothetical protein
LKPNYKTNTVIVSRKTLMLSENWLKFAQHCRRRGQKVDYENSLFCNELSWPNVQSEPFISNLLSMAAICAGTHDIKASFSFCSMLGKVQPL